MMEEEDGFDLPPTPEGMADVDVSLSTDGSRPTLLLAGTTKPADFTEQKNDSADIVGVEKEVISNKIELESEKMTKENVNAEKDCLDGNGKGLDGNQESASGPNTIKELFGESAESDGFLSSNSKQNSLPTASALFSSTGDSHDLFANDKKSDPFPVAPSKVPNFEEQRKDDGSNAMGLLGESLQDLTVKDNNSIPDFPGGSVPGIPAMSHFTNQGTASKNGQAAVLTGSFPNTQSAPAIYSPPGNTTSNSTPLPGQTHMPGFQNPDHKIPGTFNQGQTPMLYNPQNFAPQNQNYPSPNQNDPIMNRPENVDMSQNRATIATCQNIANVGNSYMYTAPIASVIPQYEQPQRNGQSVQQPPARLYQSHVPKQVARPAGELFVPDLYGSPSSTQPSQVNIFTPDAVPTYNISASNTPQTNFSQQDATPNTYNMQNSYGAYQGANQSDINSYDYGSIQPLSYSNQQAMTYSNAHDPGFWEWVKNQPWGEEAQRLGKQILQKTKNATDTVLTTLDPGMEEYLNPVVHLAIGSQDSNIMQAIRQGFKNVFGHTAAKGHGVQHSYARLPIGFDLATKSVTEKLDAITAIDFKFNQPYVHVAIQPFLTELQQGRWSCMLCLAIRDCSKQIQLQTFSQPIQIPSQCISIAYNKTSQEVAQYGLDVDIDEAVRLYQPYANDQDWCSTLTGIKLETVITMAAQGLAAEYRRELDNPSVTNVESFVVMQ
ncbi:protein PRRC1-like isoform X2 [Rhopilema esculentum]|uniref:protein PRRC1-like isoform X2 n=1 Tax=Rhopilema esculentum TaxID=499914 RepID=UPI0031DCAC11